MAKVLVADDSETILLLMRTRLEMAGHAVETASDGQEVLERIADDGMPDLLLLDAMMPRRSGIDALRTLREQGIETPALIVSAHADSRGAKEDETDLAIGGYIPKPIDFDALFAKIAELTG
jgi:CheY-like chemotaxis protein